MDQLSFESLNLPHTKSRDLSHLFHQLVQLGYNQFSKDKNRKALLIRMAHTNDIEINCIYSIYMTLELNINQSYSIIDQLKRDIAKLIHSSIIINNNSIFTYYSNSLRVDTLLSDDIHFENYEYYLMFDCLSQYQKLYDNGFKDNNNFIQFIVNTKPWKPASHSLFYGVGGDRTMTVTKENKDIFFTKASNMSVKLTNKIGTMIEHIQDRHPELSDRDLPPHNFTDTIKRNSANKHLYTNTYHAVIKLLWVSVIKSFNVSIFDTLDAVAQLNEYSLMTKSQIIEIINVALILNPRGSIDYDDEKNPWYILRSIASYNDTKKPLTIPDIIKSFMFETKNLRREYFMVVMDRVKSLVYNSGEMLEETNVCFLQNTYDRLFSFANDGIPEFYRPDYHTMDILLNISDKPVKEEYLSRKEEMKSDYLEANSKRDEFESQQRSIIEIKSKSLLQLDEGRYLAYANYLWMTHINRNLNSTMQLIHIQRLYNLDLNLKLDGTYELNDLMAFTITTNIELDDPKSKLRFTMGSAGLIILEILIKTDRKYYQVLSPNNYNVYGFQIYIIMKTERGAANPRWSFISTEGGSSPPSPKARHVAFKHLSNKIPPEFNPEKYEPVFTNVTSQYAHFLYPSSKYMSMIKNTILEIYSPEQVFIRFTKVMWIIELIAYGILTPTSYGKRQWIHEYTTNIVHIDPKQFVDYYLDKLRGFTVSD
jgi:hypothetical protein